MKQSLPKIDTYRLLLFYHVCNEKSITAAAEKLFLSQPTITTHMKTLERSIQTKLFKIERQKLVLTQIGEGLYDYAREIYQQAMAADRYIEVSKESSLKIGISSLLVQKMAQAINTMLERRKLSINLEAHSGESFTLIKELSDASIDLAVVPNFDFGTNNFSHIRVVDRVKLIFYANASNPIFKKMKIDWSDVFDYPLIIGTENSPMARIVAKKIDQEGLKKSPRYYFTADNFDFFKTIVKNGDSISFSLLEDIQDDVDKGILKVLPLTNDICVDIDIVGYQNYYSIEMVKEFIACVKDAFNQATVI
jgi:LysR family transcriptional regulator, transcriptional activator of the cysJI operon